ncbi:MAG TPA: VacJ family lipoprotein [Methylibium sp.]|uniref:MlaA family lipoprotein n=1 Tax=Methylibium sp. TaxID=2067992 RepID=UPI002DB7FA48|nr:VacJ family lipoprotein [Methylibium sp.]HEU4458935.1 VacJ family lipoprotein [Methylibium sp.]
MRRRPRPARAPLAAAALAAALLVGGCATVEKPDPLEPMNRQVFAFNETVDEYAIAPAARVYRDIVPRLARIGIDNFFNNLKDGWSAINLLLQGRPGDSANDLMRFTTNTVLGLGGVLDWATEFGLEPHYEDFGQTLGIWGLPAGAYLVLPVLGPSSLRDAAALPLDIQASPDQVAQSVATRNTLTGVRVLNTRARLLGATGMLDDIALDKYSFVRDAYLQRRRSQVYDGEPPEGSNERYDLPEAGAPAPDAAASAPAPAASAPPGASAPGEGK